MSVSEHRFPFSMSKILDCDYKSDAQFTLPVLSTNVNTSVWDCLFRIIKLSGVKQGHSGLGSIGTAYYV